MALFYPDLYSMKSTVLFKIVSSLITVAAVYILLALIEQERNPRNWSYTSLIVFLVLAGVWLWSIVRSKEESE